MKTEDKIRNKIVRLNRERMKTDKNCIHYIKLIYYLVKEMN